MHRLSVQGDFASIRALCPRQDLHQRALARTVFSNQCVDLPRPYRKIHALQRLHAGEPHKMNWLVWFYFLIHAELRRQRRALKQAKAEVVSLEELKVLPDDAEKASGYDAERPLDIIEQELEPPVVKTEGLLPDLHAVPPDEIAAEKDLLEHLQTAVQSWPRAEREIFELYFIEGFDPDEIAMVTRQTLKTVQENISSIQNRLREGVLEQALI